MTEVVNVAADAGADLLPVVSQIADDVQQIAQGVWVVDALALVCAFLYFALRWF